MANYKSKFQGEDGIFKVNKKSSGQTYYGTSKKKKKEKGVIFKLERLYDKAKEVAAETGETIAEAFERVKKGVGLNEGGMPRKRTGHTDFRKGGMVLNTTNNKRNR